MDIQVWLSELIGNLASMLQLGYAFGAGMVAAVNPCGFVMLPVYLSLYLGADEQQFEQRSWFFRLARAVGVSSIVTAGFGLLFGVIGVIVSAGGSFLLHLMPWISIIIGAALILLGIWMMLGRHLSLDFMTALSARIGDPRAISVKGFFLFGLGFGATSLGCTLPIFLVVVGGSLTAGDFMSGLIQFLFYILGTGTILLILSVAMAFIKGGAVVALFRKIIPYVNTISGILLILAGGYICYYWFSSGLLFP
ncbi:MAG: sulfite exporter TauE/SafE family protein [Desulfofustis sp.]|nr:sulfite exporter TauE/SafE family protein [Desulfofustis sp.]